MSSSPKFKEAPSVGVGVPRTTIPKAARPSEPEKPEDILKNFVEDLANDSNWSDTPYAVGQIADTDQWRVHRSEVRVFDLSKTEELQAYNNVLSTQNIPGTNQIIRESERKWCEQTGNWKVLVTLDFIKYRRLVKILKEP